MKGRVICAGSVSVDEEMFPWRGNERHQPLLTSTKREEVGDHEHLHDSHQVADSPNRTSQSNDIRSGDTVSDLNQPTSKSLSFLSLYSGRYQRPNGIPHLNLKR